MKKFFQTLIIITIALVFGINCFAYKIDGSIDSPEWQNAPYKKNLVTSDSGCNITALIVQYDTSKEKSEMYLSILVSEKIIVEDHSNFAIHMSSQDGETIVISQQELDYDKNVFDIKCIFSPSTFGFSCEMIIVFKDGLKDNFELNIFAVDSDGIRSRTYTFPVDIEQTDVETHSSEKISANANISAAERTTKSKTTKASNSKSKKSDMPYVTVTGYQKNVKTKTSKTLKAQSSQEVSESEEEYSTQLFKRETTSRNNSVTRKPDTGKVILKTIAVGVIIVTIGAFVMSTRTKKEN